jgi:hypothetical protein
MNGAVSVVDAAHEAVRHTREHLFPFRLRTWITLGLVAFLDQCGRGTGFGGGGVPGNPAGEQGDAFDPRPLLRWMLANPMVAAAAAIVVLAGVVVVLAFVLFVNSRGSFAYADLVATGRAEVARPWKEHRLAARSYFAVRFVLVGATLVGLLALVLALATAALGVVGERPRPAYVLLAFGLLFLMLLFAVAVSLASVLLRDFVVPLQLAHGLSCLPAARVLRALVAAHPGAFLLYVALKVALTLAVALAMLAVCCLTCSLGLLPVVGQTLLQPVYFFERAWSLFLLRQMGHDVFAALAPAV